MPEFLRFPIGALLWDIWQRNRIKFAWLLGIMVTVGAMNWLTPDRMFAGRSHPAPGWPFVLDMITQSSQIVTLVLAFAIFGYTEFDVERSALGFPRRLFVTPVRTLTLISVPVIAGIVGVELVAVWIRSVMRGHSEISTLLAAVVIGAYLVLYQAFMWTIGGRLGPIRTVILAVVSMIFFALSTGANPTYSEQSLIVAFAGVAIVCFVIAWMTIDRQRSGGGKMKWLPLSSRDLSERLPGRTKVFRSAMAAQFWYEWRRAGTVLPIIAAGVLFGALAPLASVVRADPGDSGRILAAAVLVPIVLAAVVGKAFSKPEFWSSDLSLSTAVAVKPIANIDLIAIKVRVAAASAATTWFLILLFLSLWARFWASPTLLAMIRFGIARIYGDSALPQMMAALLVVLGFFLTWRLLVVSLWLGSSGANKIFGLTALPYVVVPIIGLGMLVGLMRSGTPIYGTVQTFFDRWNSVLIFFAAMTIVVKIGFARSRLSAEAKPRTLHYLGYWFAATTVLLVLMALLWQGIQQIPAPGVATFRNVLFVGALLFVPLGRLSLATAFLARNRHR